MSPIKDAIIPVFIAYEVHDEYGRCRTLRSVHRNREDAKLAAANLGWYGGPGDVDHGFAIEDGDDLYILKSIHPECFYDVAHLREQKKKQAIETAMSKLTPEEIELLGLKK